jgi:hypothetical protein
MDTLCAFELPLFHPASKGPRRAIHKPIYDFPTLQNGKPSIFRAFTPLTR